MAIDIKKIGFLRSAPRATAQGAFPRTPTEKAMWRKLVKLDLLVQERSEVGETFRRTGRGEAELHAFDSNLSQANLELLAEIKANPASKSISRARGIMTLIEAGLVFVEEPTQDLAIGFSLHPDAFGILSHEKAPALL